ncbi:DUF2267 domain-containing protein [Streptomyces rhizosphaericus]|uniref:DUF2267 domain-containing protein n=1 Tax=Streptomyces rhizosphaericus TaxID=114699 RepID=UPI0035D46B21
MISDRQTPPQQPYGTAYEQMLEKVRYEGAYPTRERADEAVRLVLAGLGRQLTGDERVDLVGCLPPEAAHVLAEQIPDPQPLTGWSFVEDLAARTGAPGHHPLGHWLRLLWRRRLRALSRPVAVALRRACVNTPPPAAQDVPAPGVQPRGAGCTNLAHSPSTRWRRRPEPGEAKRRICGCGPAPDAGCRCGVRR